MEKSKIPEIYIYVNIYYRYAYTYERSFKNKINLSIIDYEEITFVCYGFICSSFLINMKFSLSRISHPSPSNLSPVINEFH